MGLDGGDGGGRIDPRKVGPTGSFRGACHVEGGKGGANGWIRGGRNGTVAWDFRGQEGH